MGAGKGERTRRVLPPRLVLRPPSIAPCVPQAGGNALSRVETIKLCTLLVLSCRTESMRLGSGAAAVAVPTATNAVARSSHNPVLIALRLSIRCREGARLHTRDGRHADRMRHVAEMLETIACGLVDGALLAEEQSKEEKGYNPWRTGTAPVDPAAVCRTWVEGSVDFSATKGLVRFSSIPSVYGVTPARHYVPRLYAHASLPLPSQFKTVTPTHLSPRLPALASTSFAHLYKTRPAVRLLPSLNLPPARPFHGVHFILFRSSSAAPLLPV